MGIHFSVDEIFDMAIQLERNGATFYKRAAKDIGNQKISQLLLDLASMENEHEKVFVNMRNGLTELERGSNLFDPDNQTTSYLKALVDGQVFNMQSDPAKQLTGNISIRDILQIAVSLEKDSIIFYLGMKELTAKEWGRERIDDIVKEEMNHISDLNSMLANLKQETG